MNHGCSRDNRIAFTNNRLYQTGPTLIVGPFIVILPVVLQWHLS
jgi:hypothetical protein